MVLPQLAIEGHKGYEEAINSARSSCMRERKIAQGSGQVGMQNRILNSPSKSTKTLGSVGLLSTLNLPLIRKNSASSG